MNMARRFKCFMVMPFDPVLHYFYLFIQQHLEKKYPLRVERGDQQIQTFSLNQKLKNCIHEADGIIADISGKNANAMYEIGLADAYGKPIIMLTKDSIHDVPSDLKHHEFIQYDLSNHVLFLNKLDNAINNLLSHNGRKRRRG